MKEGRRSFLKMLGIGAAIAPVAAAGIAFTVNDAQADFAKKLPGQFLDQFYIDPAKIPAGVQYNWKRAFITSGERDIENLSAMITNGWRPVPASRHPEADGGGYHYWIEVGGLVLMEKPST